MSNMEQIQGLTWIFVRVNVPTFLVRRGQFFQVFYHSIQCARRKYQYVCARCNINTIHQMLTFGKLGFGGLQWGFGLWPWGLGRKWVAGWYRPWSSGFGWHYSLCGSNVTYALGHSVLLQDSRASGVNLSASNSCDEEPTETCFLLFPKKMRTTKKYSWRIPRPISRSLAKLFPELFPETVLFRPLPCKIKKTAKKNNSRNAPRISHVIPAGFRT